MADLVTSARAHLDEAARLLARCGQYALADRASSVRTDAGNLSHAALTGEPAGFSDVRAPEGRA